MSKKAEFINYVKTLMENSNVEMNEDASSYWSTFCSVNETEKPPFTDNGKLILQFLKDHTDEKEAWKSKDIAEELFISSRSVGGSLRKLVSDGYVDKVGENPIVYSLTEKGKKVEF